MVTTRTIGVRGSLTLLALGLVVLLTPAARAQDGVTQTAVDRAERFLNAGSRGRDVVGFVHFGTKYRGHSYQRRLGVTRAGNRVPGHFALVYRVSWADDGESDVAFLCDAAGSIYEVQVTWTNAQIAQPFVFANGAIQVLGNTLIQALGNNLTPAQRQEFQTLVNNADAKRLLEWSLRVQQSLGR